MWHRFFFGFFCSFSDESSEELATVGEEEADAVSSSVDDDDGDEGGGEEDVAAGTVGDAVSTASKVAFTWLLVTTDDAVGDDVLPWIRIGEGF